MPSLAFLRTMFRRADPPKEDCDALLATARGLHDAGRIAEAERLYRRILAADPDNAPALHLLGVVALQAGQFQAAVDLIGQAIARDDAGG